MFLVHFETTGTDDNLALDTVEMPYVPRKGETVLLRGEEYGGMRAFNPGYNHTMFEVEDVTYDIDKLEEEQGHDVSVTVFLRLHVQDAETPRFVPRCTCAKDMRVPSQLQADRCGNCGNLAWWKKG